MLSLTIPRTLDFLAPPSWYCFYTAFIGKQGVDLVPLHSDSGSLWDKGVRDCFEKLMKAIGFLLRKKCKSTQTFTKDLYLDLG